MILKKFDIPGCETYLEERTCEDTGRNYKVLTCKIDGREYSFNVDWVEDSNRLDWLASVYGGSLVQLRKFTVGNVKKEISDKFDDFADTLRKSL